MPPVLRPRKGAISASKSTLSTFPSRDDGRTTKAQMKVFPRRQAKSERKKPVYLSSDDDPGTPQLKKIEAGQLNARCKHGRILLPRFTKKVSSSSNDDESEVSPCELPGSSNLSSQNVVKEKHGSKTVISEEKNLIEGVIGNEAKFMSGVLQVCTGFHQTDKMDRSIPDKDRKLSSTPKDAEGLKNSDEKIVSRKLFEDELHKDLKSTDEKTVIPKLFEDDLHKSIERVRDVGFIVEGVTKNVVDAPEDIISEGSEYREVQDISIIDKVSEFLKEGRPGGRIKRRSGKQLLENKTNVDNASEENREVLDIDKDVQTMDEEKPIRDKKLEKITEGGRLPCDTHSVKDKNFFRSSNINKSVLKRKENSKLRSGGSKQVQIGRDDFSLPKEPKDLLMNKSLAKVQDNCSEVHSLSCQKASEESPSGKSTVDDYKAMDNLPSQERTQTVVTDMQLTEKLHIIDDQIDHFCKSEEDANVKRTFLPTVEEDLIKQAMRIRKLNKRKDVVIDCNKGELRSIEESDISYSRGDDKLISPKRIRNTDIRGRLMTDEVQYENSSPKSNGKKSIHGDDLPSFSKSKDSTWGEGQVKVQFEGGERNDLQLHNKSINEMHSIDEAHHDEVHATGQKLELSGLNFYIKEQTYGNVSSIQEKDNILRCSRNSSSQEMKSKLPKPLVKRSEAEGIAQLNSGECTNSVKRNQQLGMCENERYFLSTEACHIHAQLEEKEATTLNVDLNRGETKTRNKNEIWHETESGDLTVKNEETSWLAWNENKNDKEQQDEEEEDDEEMANLFIKSLRGYLSPASNLIHKEEKQDASTMTHSGNRATAKEMQINVIDSVSRRAPELPDFGLKTFGISEIVLPNDLLKRKSKTQVDNAGTIWQKDCHLQDGLLVLPRDPRKLNKLLRKQAKDTTGEKWFDLPAQTITPELKRELQVLKLRGALDPKRHYKAEDSKTLPKYFQVGTVIEGPAEFYSARLTKKERKGSLADELLLDSNLKSYRKRKYLQIQQQKQAGGKFWKQKKLKKKPSLVKA